MLILIVFSLITVVGIGAISYVVGYNAGLKRADAMLTEKFPWLSETERH